MGGLLPEKQVSRPRPLYQELAAKDSANFAGLSVLQHAEALKKLANKYKPKTLLDYGCGRATPTAAPQAAPPTRYPRPNVTLYGPAFRRDGILPAGKFDMVICSDVLEHVPEDEVDQLIERLFGYGRLVVWASVCCRPAKKTFADGTNMHVAVQPYEWWERKFAAYSEATRIPFVLVETRNMGYGDWLMAAGELGSRTRRPAGPVLVTDPVGTPQWSDVFEGNPYILRKPFAAGGFVRVISSSGNRPYIAAKECRSVDMEAVHADPAEMFFTDAELAFAEPHRGKIMVEPGGKPIGHQNKLWLRERWRELVTRFHYPSCSVALSSARSG